MRELRRERTGQADDAMFGRAIGGQIAMSGQPGRRRNVDDRAGGPDEVRQKENLGPMPVMPEEPGDTLSPGEVEDTAGDSVEDAVEQETDAPEVES